MEAGPTTSRVSAFDRLGNQNPVNPEAGSQQSNPAANEPTLPRNECEDPLMKFVKEHYELYLQWERKRQ